MSSSLQAQILQRMPGVVFCSRMDPAGAKSTWLYISPGAAAFYDVDEDALQSDPFTLLERVPPEERVQIEQHIAECARTGAPFFWTGRNLRRDGTVRWLETHATIEPDKDGTMLWYGQALDVTARKELELALIASEAERAKSESLFRQVIDAMPLGVMVANQANEFLVMNPAQQRITGGIAAHEDGDVSRAYGIFMADGVTPLPMENTGMARGLRGESLEEEVVLRNPRLVGDVRLHVVWTPLTDAAGKVFAALGTAQDITLQRALEAELRTRNGQLAASEEAKTQLIERLRLSIEELSTPILEVWDDVLAMPIIGVVDSRRTAEMVHRLLAEVARTQASFVIVDLTGVEIVDTQTADHLMKLMRKVEIVGARCVLTGIRPAVSETLVDIGVDFGRLATLRNLKHGLREALRHARRERDGMREVDLDDELADRAKRRAGATPQ